MRSAALPGRNDDALAGALAALARGTRSGSTRWKQRCAHPDSQPGPDLRRDPVPAAPPDRCRRRPRAAASASWPAGAWPSTVFRQALASVGAPRMFDVKLPAAAELASQRIRFASHLFHAAGYAGWCLLLDEVELIGRYTPLQRGVAYAWLAPGWGWRARCRFPGVATVYAITDDFVAAVIEHRQDTERLSERLLLKGREQESLMAVAAIRHIEDAVQRHRLPLPGAGGTGARLPPAARDLRDRRMTGPRQTLAPGERTATRTMRQYIKAWITQWDMLRLGDGGGAIVEETVRSNYEEDEGLAAPQSGAEDELG